MYARDALLNPEKVAEALARNWDGLDAFWRDAVVELLEAVGSDSDPQAVIERAAAEPVLVETAEDWDGLDGDRRAAAWDRIGDRLTRLAYETRPHCIRCGECCESASPALLLGEVGLVREGGPFYGRAYTIRAGEPVYDHRLGHPVPAPLELIKPLETETGCQAYDADEGCTVYDDRPDQCRALACWEEGEPGPEFDGPFLNREILFGTDRPEDQLRMEYVRAHQRKCPSEGLVDLAEEAAKEIRASFTRLQEIVAFDLHTRYFAKTREHLSDEEMDLVLGRPVALIIEPLGFTTIEIEGRIRLRQTS